MVTFERLGHQTAPRHLAQMVVNLPGYELFEVFGWTDCASIRQRLTCLLSHAVSPPRHRVVKAKPRTYGNLLAVPARSTAAAALAGSDV